ncbi:hypothetical protein M9B39_00310 [SAR86 cluster bacterium]|nr:hypothetical protein M9B39_00310 [SAR86 cluster bacterium]
MSEQIVEIIIRERKFSFRIPYSDYIPFKKAEKSVVSLIEEIGPEDDELDFGIVYSAVKLAIENNKLREKLNITDDEQSESINEITKKIEIFLNQ